MLEISKGFFDEEDRLGFHIEAMMKRAWAVQLNVLSEIDRICNKYGITYYAAGGTMLGTIRHKGYIPWDDDIDITMKRGDYERFLKVAPEEIPYNYYLHCNEYFDSHASFHAALMNGRDDKYDFPYVAGVDIFVLDYVPADEEEEFLFRTLFGLVYETARTCRETGREELQDNLSQIKELTGVEVVDDGRIQHNLWVLAHQIAKMYSREESKGITHIPNIVCRDIECYVPIECYDDSIRMPFEMTTVPVAVGYDKALKALYGEDYMTPKNVRARHDYPFYASQQKMSGD